MIRLRLRPRPFASGLFCTVLARRLTRSPSTPREEILLGDEHTFAGRQLCCKNTCLDLGSGCSATAGSDGLRCSGSRPLKRTAVLVDRISRGRRPAETSWIPRKHAAGPRAKCCTRIQTRRSRRQSERVWRLRFAACTWTRSAPA